VQFAGVVQYALALFICYAVVCNPLEGFVNTWRSIEDLEDRRPDGVMEVDL
jgi:hypothetical protein